MSDNQARRNAARRLMTATGVYDQAALLALAAEQSAHETGAAGTQSTIDASRRV